MANIEVYASVLFDAKVTTHQFLSGDVEPDLEAPEIWFGIDGDNGDNDCSRRLRIWPEELEFAIHDLESVAGLTRDWLRKRKDGDDAERFKMETAYANSEANAGRGWNNTREDIIDSVLEQLHSAN